MTTSTRLLRQKLLLSSLIAKKPGRRGLAKGFTLIELLVVVIIVAILSSIAIPSFLDQALKAKVSAAKSLVSSAVKECQVYLVDPPTGGFSQSVGGTTQVTLLPDKLSTACTNTTSWTATVVGANPATTYTAGLAVNANTGIISVNKTCTGALCDATLTW